MPQVSLLGRPVVVVPAALGQIVRTKQHHLSVIRSISTSSVVKETTEPRRRIHSSSNRSSPPLESSILDADSVETFGKLTTSDNALMANPPPLSILPLSTVIRTLATSTISASPILLPPSLWAMNVLAHTEVSILNPDKNPILGWFLKKTFYAQFCAGENATEVRETIQGLKGIGFTGVILGYAREIVLSDSQTKNLTACDSGPEKDECVRQEIEPWAAGTMETVRLAQPGDFVALKFTGAGRQALYALKYRRAPPVDLRKAIDAVCEMARERNIALLFDAEQTAFQAGIDDWTLEYQRRYNTIPSHALIYGTYQAYLKSTPATLASHLATASREGFTLGVKLVRGAYLGSDPREIIHDTKEDTDRCYNGVAEAVIRREWNDTLCAPPSSRGSEKDGPGFPLVSLVLGSHNLASVRRARAVRDSITVEPPTTTTTSPTPTGPVAELAIAQLQGMADEVSCELLAVKRTDQVERTRAYKYLVWGTTGECMKYLLRRARENRDAVQRTRDGRDAMFAEVRRRVWNSVSGRKSV